MMENRIGRKKVKWAVRGRPALPGLWKLDHPPLGGWFFDERAKHFAAQDVALVFGKPSSFV